MRLTNVDREVRSRSYLRQQTLVALFLALALSFLGVASAQQIAVQVSVRDIGKRDLGENRLVVVRGYLDTSGKVPLLHDVETRDSVVVDFAQSQVRIEKLSATREEPAPVEITGFIGKSETYGQVILVVGASDLTP